MSKQGVRVIVVVNFESSVGQFENINNF